MDTILSVSYCESSHSHVSSGVYTKSFSHLRIVAQTEMAMITARIFKSFFNVKTSKQTLTKVNKSESSDTAGRHSGSCSHQHEQQGEEMRLMLNQNSSASLACRPPVISLNGRFKAYRCGICAVACLWDGMTIRVSLPGGKSYLSSVLN